jgi:hypothetical protein
MIHLLYLSDESHRKVLTALYAALWFIWAIIPLVIMVLLNPRLPPNLKLWLTISWKPLALVWTLAFVVLFTWMLTSSIAALRRQEVLAQSQVAQCLLGVMCSLSFGLPAFALGAVPFFALNLTSLQQLFPHGNVVDLRSEDYVGIREPLPGDEEEKTAERKPNEYIIGIDVSQRFLGPVLEVDPEGAASPVADARHERYERITNTILDLFDPKGIIGQAYQPNDVLTIWTFAGATGQDPWLTNREPSGRGSPTRREWILRHLNPVSLKSRVQEVREDREADSTDLLGFLKTNVLAELQGRDYHQAKVILFSDMKHLENFGDFVTGAEEVKRGDEIEGEIVTTAEKIKQNRGLSLVAFTEKALEDTQDERIEKDVGLRFDGLLRPRSWQSADLMHYSARNAEEKAVQLLGLYEDLRERGTLYLKYDKSRDNQSLPSFLLLNDSTSWTVLGLRKRNSVSKGEAETRTYMRIRAGADKSCSLELDGIERSAQKLNLSKGERDQVPIELDSGFGILGDPQVELLVAMPPKVIYRIPIKVLAMEETDIVEALGWVFLLLNCIPLVLLYHGVRSKWQDLNGVANHGTAKT